MKVQAQHLLPGDEVRVVTTFGGIAGADAPSRSEFVHSFPEFEDEDTVVIYFNSDAPEAVVDTGEEVEVVSRIDESGKRKLV